jgi:hypothetical protein
LPLLHNGKYRIQDSLDLIYDLGIPESDDMVALAFEIGRALSIITSWRVFRMLAAVELDDETNLMTGEIGEVAPDRNLAAKCVPSIGMRHKCFQSLVSASVASARRRRLLAILKRSSLEGFWGRGISVSLKQRS